MARSCATRDANNEDYVSEPTIPAGINRPPLSETISRVTRMSDHQTRLTGIKDSFSARDPVGQFIFIYDGISRAKNLEYPPRSEESPLGGNLE